MNAKPIVVVSSTARDLPDERAMVMDACLRVDMDPKMMEHLPALAADAIRASLDLVDKANVYVGVFAHRYGYIPDGHDISITEMEYERAAARGIPRLIFLMDEEVPVLPKDVDKGESAEKLEKLKERLKKEQVIAFFKNPEDLRGLVIHALGRVKEQFDAVDTNDDGRAKGAALARSIHYFSEIPEPPEPYVAHPYTLLQVRGLVGRKEEMELLTDWVTGKRGFRDVRIFNVVAIGGMGKSALTWKWFNDVAPQEMAPLAGRVWWSFYESDATFENFVTRTLTYASRRSLDEVKKLSFPEQEDLLLRILDREPFLLALDGLERILIAYARQDAAYLRDEDALDEETANRVAGAYGLPKSAGQSYVGKHKLRRTADVRAGRFLRRLANVRASRILISTRLYPADLQAPMGDPMPGCSALFLKGLSDHDALALWREYGAKGSREGMLPVFRTFDKHPLLLQMLAYEVAGFRDAPGDFDAWKAANPDFQPFGLDLANVQSHVLAHAMRGLSAAELRTLHVIAGFRMPASGETLKALLIRTGGDDVPPSKPFATLADFDAALTALEDRGLLGWDRRANRYDLHPIVRGVVWTSLDDDTRRDVYGTLRKHFEAIPMVGDFLQVESLHDLTSSIELYNILIGIQRYDDAFHIFMTQLEEAMLYRLSASRMRVELLERLFPNGPTEPPPLSQPSDQSRAVRSLASAYHLSGQPGAAISLDRLADAIVIRKDDFGRRSIDLDNQSSFFRQVGHLRAAEMSARAALVIDRAHENRFQEAVSLQWLGTALTASGISDDTIVSFRRALRIWHAQDDLQGIGIVSASMGETALLRGDTLKTLRLALTAWGAAEVTRVERDSIEAARLLGTAELQNESFVRAGELLHHALLRARAVSLLEQELPSIIALAELHRQQNEATQARAMLEDVWEPAERGPYPLFHVDALNVLAQIERDAGNTAAAVEAATAAYRFAWCDGPPFAYHWGLEKARAHLAALGAPEPEMPPFDESQHEPMPEVEINPPDEYGGDDEPDWEAILNRKE